MELGNFKPVIIAITTAFSALIYTKKRIRKENKLKAIHSKTAETHGQDFKRN
ncbi:MAG TPA: hypothetical protein VGI61_07025 [Parafilimonas sp.]|jgi:hypothetical protein